MDTDKPLPVSFWNDITDEDRARAAITTDVVSEPDPHAELESWRESFAALGTSVEDAMRMYYGQPSIDKTPMHTYEQVYRNLQMVQINEHDAAKEAEKSRDPKDEKRASREIYRREVTAAHAAWKQAIVDQQIAMAQWRRYVNELHAVYSQIKRG